jgi:hypothetical protein
MVEERTEVVRERKRPMWGDGEETRKESVRETDRTNPITGTHKTKVVRESKTE